MRFVLAWTAPPSAYALPASFPDRFEVLVFANEVRELTSGVVLQRKGESTRAVMARVQAKLEEIRKAELARTVIGALGP